LDWEDETVDHGWFDTCEGEIGLISRADECEWKIKSLADPDHVNIEDECEG
jgi:hypothetical protein